MKRFLSLVLVLICLAALFPASSSLAELTAVSVSTEDFSFTDADGAAHALSDYADKTLVILYGRVISGAGTQLTLEALDKLMRDIDQSRVTAIFFELDSAVTAETLKSYASDNALANILLVPEDAEESNSKRARDWFIRSANLETFPGAYLPMSYIVSGADGVIHSYSQGRQTQLELTNALCAVAGGDLYAYPTGTSVCTEGDSLVFSWIAYGEAVSYQIWRYAYSADTTAKLGTTSETSFTDTSAEKNERYSYAVRAELADGTFSSYSSGAYGYLRESMATAESTALAELLAYRINIYRHENGLSLLKLTNAMSECAQTRSEELRFYLTHGRPDGSRWASVLSGVSYSYAGELIAGGTVTDAATLIDTWLADTEANGILSDSAYLYFGVGCCVFEGKTYFSVNLIASDESFESSYPKNPYASFSVSPSSVNMGKTVTLSAAGGSSYRFLLSDGTLLYEGSSSIFLWTPIAYGSYTLQVEILGDDGLTTVSIEELNVTINDVMPLLRGDADCNGVVNTGDAAAILRDTVHIKMLSAQGQKNADIDGTVGVNAADAARVLRWTVKLEPAL